MEKKDIIIIGAGCSGLLAAMELSGKFNVTVLEANTYYGGRIRTIKDECLIESGAEFLHGNSEITRKYLDKAGLSIEPVQGAMYRYKNGQLQKEEDFIEGWDQLLKKMKQADYDMSLHDFLYSEFSGEEFEALRNQAIAYSNGFDLADPQKVSIRGLKKEWSKQEKQARPAEGYSSLINYFADKSIDNGAKIILDQTVIQVDWEEDFVVVYTKSGEKYHASKLLVTIPVSLISLNASDHSVNFTPPIDSYVEAARNIGFGRVIKYSFEFTKPAWPDDTGFIFSEERVPTWWVRCNAGHHLLTGWLGGPDAKELASLSNEQLVLIALESLSVILNKSSEELENLITEKLVFNWSKMPSALGGYSYPTLYQDESKEQLNKPLLDTVYFAGEALHRGDHPGTVEAALNSAEIAIKRILRR